MVQCVDEVLDVLDPRRPIAPCELLDFITVLGASPLSELACSREQQNEFIS